MPILTALQSLRALAAILVVWSHAIDLATARQLRAAQVDFAFIENFGAVGVDLFFVISGFIVSISAGRSPSMGLFHLRRAVRIWPLYALSTLLMAVLLWAGPVSLTLSLLFIQRPGEPSAVPVNAVGWSLLLEVAFYGLLALAMRWRSQRPLAERVLIVLALAVAAGSMTGFPQPLNVWGNPILVEFAMGVWIGMLWLEGRRPSALAVACLWGIGLTLLCGTLTHGFGKIWEAQHTLNVSASWDRVRQWGVPAACIVAAAVFSGSTRHGVALPFLGDASYSIYLFSPAALWALDRWLWTSATTFSTDAMIVLSTVVATAAGVVAYLAVERPLLRWLRASAWLHRIEGRLAEKAQARFNAPQTPPA